MKHARGGFWPRSYDSDNVARCVLCAAYTFRLLQHAHPSSIHRGTFSPVCSIHVPFYTCINVIVLVALIRHVLKIFESRLLALSRLFVRPSVRPPTLIEELGYHSTDFHENLYLSIFIEFDENIQVSLKFEKNNGYFT